MKGRFVDQASNSAQLAKAYREGALPADLGAPEVPRTLLDHVEGFADATARLGALVAQQREAAVTYQDVRAATAEANARMRGAGVARGGDADGSRPGAGGAAGCDFGAVFP